MLIHGWVVSDTFGGMMKKWISSLRYFLTLLCCCICASDISSQTGNTIGLLSNTEESYDGYTLFIPGRSTRTYLLDNCGHEVHQWISDYRPGLSAYLTDEAKLIRTGIYQPTFFPAGGTGGVVQRLAWDSTVEWEGIFSDEQYVQHHDIELLPNGNILVLAWEYVAPVQAVQLGRDEFSVGPQGIWGEMILEIQPVGSDHYDIIWEWHLLDHIIQDIDATKSNYGVIADHPELVDINYSTAAVDLFHANSIDYNTDLDQILINCRNMHEFYIIDHSTTSEEAATSIGGNSGRGGDILYRWGNPHAYERGGVDDQKFFLQHGCRWIDIEGPYHHDIIAFNNGAGRPQGDFSSVEIITPPLVDGTYVLDNATAFGPDDFHFAYVGSPVSSFFSARLSNATMLANQNILVCEGQSGRLFEINQEKEIVWEYINPISGDFILDQGDNPPNADIFMVDRYNRDHMGIIQQEIVDQGPIEFNSEYTCEIFENPVSTLDQNTPLSIRMNTLVYNHLWIDNLTEGSTIEIWDLQGTVLHHQYLDIGHNYIDIDAPAGILLARISDDSKSMIHTYKLVKL